MKGYIHYVHDIPETRKSWFSWAKKKDVADYKGKIGSINELQKAILRESNQKVFNWVSEHLSLEKYFKNIIFSTKDKSYVDDVDFNNVRSIINFRPINEIKYVNEHFRSVNTLLPDAGIYIGRVETYWERKIRFFRKYGSNLGQFLWLVDFVINRVIPKLRPFNKLYKFFSKNRIHPKSQAEILGRLVYCGFEIIEFTIIDNLFYFVVMKTREPLDDPEPTYHALVKLRRVGQGGRMFNVFKFRTMHPYSEYLQKYVLKLYGYNDVGKPAYDFRLARWGKFFRKTWLDELPQSINVMRGEMKVVGIRPLSLVRYNQFPLEIQQERIKYKPGCIPPYVSLNMPDDKGNIEAEQIYFRDLAKHPFLTDIKYFFKALFNILTHRIRSS